MKKLFSYIIVAVLLFSCGNSKKGNMTVKGTIKGLKKGTLYLQKYQDSLWVSVDSVQLNGNGEFTLVDENESPEIYLLALDKLSDEKISFFGEPGEITITSKLEKLIRSAKIEGSKNQELLEEHTKMAQQFSDRSLDIIKEKFDAQKNNDTQLLSNLEAEEKNLLRRKYLYTTNFAVQNSNKEIAPYLALTELFNANIKLLDTVNNSLTENIKDSKYGKQLNKFIEDIRKIEN